MRRLISMLFTLALLVLVIYNIRQVSALRREVAALKTEVAALKSGRGEPSSSEMLSLVQKAWKHADQAKRHVVEGDFKRARVELDRSLELMERAGRDAGAPSAGTLEKVQRSLRETRATIERLWRALDEKPDKAKGG